MTDLSADLKSMQHQDKILDKKSISTENKIENKADSLAISHQDLSKDLFTSDDNSKIILSDLSAQGTDLNSMQHQDKILDNKADSLAISNQDLSKNLSTSDDNSKIILSDLSAQGTDLNSMQHQDKILDNKADSLAISIQDLNKDLSDSVDDSKITSGDIVFNFSNNITADLNSKENSALYDSYTDELLKTLNKYRIEKAELLERANTAFEDSEQKSKRIYNLSFVIHNHITEFDNYTEHRYAKYILADPFKDDIANIAQAFGNIIKISSGEMKDVQILRADSLKVRTRSEATKQKNKPLDKSSEDLLNADNDEPFDEVGMVKDNHVVSDFAKRKGRETDARNKVFQEQAILTDMLQCQFDACVSEKNEELQCIPWFQQLQQWSKGESALTHEELLRLLISLLSSCKNEMDEDIKSFIDSIAAKINAPIRNDLASQGSNAHSKTNNTSAKDSTEYTKDEAMARIKEAAIEAEMVNTVFVATDKKSSTFCPNCTTKETRCLDYLHKVKLSQITLDAEGTQRIFTGSYQVTCKHCGHRHYVSSDAFGGKCTAIQVVNFSTKDKLLAIIEEASKNLPCDKPIPQSKVNSYVNKLRKERYHCIANADALYKVSEGVINLKENTDPGYASLNYGTFKGMIDELERKHKENKKLKIKKPLLKPCSLTSHEVITSAYNLFFKDTLAVITPKDIKDSKIALTSLYKKIDFPIVCFARSIALGALYAPKNAVYEFIKSYSDDKDDYESRQTFTMNMIQATAGVIAPLNRECRRYLLKNSNVIIMDETPVKYTDEHGNVHHGYIFAMRTGHSEKRQITYMQFFEDRKGENALELLNYLMEENKPKFIKTDGYSGYNGIFRTLEGQYIFHSNCFTHARRPVWQYLESAGLLDLYKRLAKEGFEGFDERLNNEILTNPDLDVYSVMFIAILYLFNLLFHIDGVVNSIIQDRTSKLYHEVLDYARKKWSITTFLKIDLLFKLLTFKSGFVEIIENSNTNEITIRKKPMFKKASAAIVYWSNLREGLLTTLMSPEVELSTSAVERDMRLVSITKRACMLYRSTDGAAALSHTSTLIQNCKSADVSIEGYLTWALVNIKYRLYNMSETELRKALQNAVDLNHYKDIKEAYKCMFDCKPYKLKTLDGVKFDVFSEELLSSSILNYVNLEGLTPYDYKELLEREKLS